MKLYKVTLDEKGGFRHMATDDPRKIYDKYPNAVIIELVTAFEFLN